MLIGMIIALIVGGAVGFFGGMKYQQGKQPAFSRQFGQGGRFGQGTGGRTGFRPTAGKIIVSDDKSITVQLQDGSSKIVFLTGTTQINKAENAAKSDLKTGEQVAVFGTDNSDGTVTAQVVQINPQFGRLRNSPTNK